MLHNIQLKDKLVKIIWKYLFVKPFTRKDPLSTTFCYIYEQVPKEEGKTKPKELSFGFACQSQKDKFDSEKARQISLDQAIRLLHVDKKDRGILWNSYWNRRTKLVQT